MKCPSLWLVAVMLAAAFASSAQANDAAPSAADDLPQRLHDAQSAFDAAVATRDHTHPNAQRLYEQAAAGFAAILAAGIESGPLRYNLANAQARLGELGRAIVNYRRALRLAPGDENIRRNLSFARNLCEVRIEPKATSKALETLLFWHFETPAATRRRVALLGYVAFWGLMGIGLFLRGPAPALVWMRRAVAVVVIAAACSVAWDRLAAAHRDEGALIRDGVVLRKGNSDSYDPQVTAPLADGVEFRVFETRHDLDGRAWLYIELPDGTDGWVPADQAELM